MSEQMLYDNQINGVGKINGGFFNHVKVNGIGEVVGDVTCHAFYCNGNGKISGHMVSKVVQVQGVCRVKGRLESLEIRVDGKVTVDDGIVSEKMQCNGAITVDSGCKAKVFHASGKVDIFGLLNANQVNLQLLATCRVREICGEQILVRQGNSKAEWMNKIISSLAGTPQLIIETINGDHITLEHTKGKIVRGNHITIGPGCEIDRVEYKTHLTIDDRSQVKQRVML